MPYIIILRLEKSSLLSNNFSPAVSALAISLDGKVCGRASLDNISTFTKHYSLGLTLGYPVLLRPQAFVNFSLARRYLAA